MTGAKVATVGGVTAFWAWSMLIWAPPILRTRVPGLFGFPLVPSQYQMQPLSYLAAMTIVLAVTVTAGISAVRARSSIVRCAGSAFLFALTCLAIILYLGDQTWCPVFRSFSGLRSRGVVEELCWWILSAGLTAGIAAFWIAAVLARVRVLHVSLLISNAVTMPLALRGCWVQVQNTANDIGAIDLVGLALYSGDYQSAMISALVVLSMVTGLVFSRAEQRSSGFPITVIGMPSEPDQKTPVRRVRLGERGPLGCDD